MFARPQMNQVRVVRNHSNLLIHTDNLQYPARQAGALDWPHNNKHGRYIVKTFNKFIAIAITAVSAVSATAGSHNLVTADVNDPVTLRINVMQNAGAATGIASAMIKGNIPFDPFTALAAFTAINTASLGLAGLFPAGAEENMRSSAGPAIWNDPTGFKSAIAKFIADSGAAKASPPASLDEFKVAFGSVTSNCKACHQKYRIKR